MEKKNKEDVVESLNEGLVDESETLKVEGFRPPDLLDVKNRDSKFAYRWVRKEKFNTGPEDIRGWERLKQLNSSGEKQKSTEGLSEPSLDGSVNVGDLTLAKMPAKKAEARNQYYREKSSVKMELLRFKRDQEKEGIETDIDAKSNKRR